MPGVGHPKLSLSKLVFRKLCVRDPLGGPRCCRRDRGRIVLQDTHLSGHMVGVELRTLPKFVGLQNCLKLGPHPFIQLPDQVSSQPMQVHVRQTTLRASGGLLRWPIDVAKTGMTPTLIIAEDSVFEFPPEQGGLLEFSGAEPPPGWDGLIRITGEGSVLREGALLAVSGAGTLSGLSPLDPSSLRLDGLMIDEFRFAGPADEDPRHSIIVETFSPRRTATPPGIDASWASSAPLFPLARPATSP